MAKSTRDERIENGIRFLLEVLREQYIGHRREKDFDHHIKELSGSESGDDDDEKKKPQQHAQADRAGAGDESSLPTPDPMHPGADHSRRGASDRETRKV